jgi:UTP--glucose-1-phosphate uridylyltransferase
MSSRVRKAVIPAAGLGTRFLPATKAQPKEMLTVVDKPAIQYVVEEAAAAGIEDVLVITSPSKRNLEDHFDRAPELEAILEQKGKTDALDEVRAITELAQLHFIRQGAPLGLGHAIGMARRHVGNEPFAVLLPDDLMIDDGALLTRMIDVQAERGGGVIGVKEFPPEEVVAYGVADVASVDGDVLSLRGIVEKPTVADAPSGFGCTGRYVFPPEIFDLIDATEPGVGGEIQITDAMTNLVDGPGLAACVYVDGRYDVGQKLDYLRATVELALDHPELGAPFRELLAQIVGEGGIR